MARFGYQVYNGTAMRTSDPFALRHCAGVDVLQQLAVVGPTGTISDLSKKLLKGVGNDSEPYFLPVAL